MRYLTAILLALLAACATPPKPIGVNPSALRDCPSKDFEACRKR